jgi:hypothetical protein
MSRSLWVVLAAFVAVGGYEGFVYFHAVSSVDSNIASLGDDISLNGEDHFRRELVAMLGKNGIASDSAAIEVTFDRERNAYDVVVPARWSIALPLKGLVFERTFHHRIPRHDELGRP